MVRHAPVFGLLLLFPLGACDLDAADAADAVTLGTSSHGVVRGEVNQGDPAVAYVAISGPSGNISSVCSGTLIDPFSTSRDPAQAELALNAGGITPPRFVLTARHCIRRSSANDDYPAGHVYAPEDIRVSFTTRPGIDDLNYRVVSHTFHPSSDLAVLELDRDVPTAPIPLNSRALEDYVGETIRVAGFGVTDTGVQNAGTKRVGTALILSASTEGMVRDSTRQSLDQNHDVAVLGQGDGGQTICSGDSGGPEFLRVGDVEFVAAVTSFSYGPPPENSDERVPDCKHPDTVAGVVRVDKNIDWIRAFIQEKSGITYVPEGGAGAPAPVFGGCSAGGPAHTAGLALLFLFAMIRRRR